MKIDTIHELAGCGALAAIEQLTNERERAQPARPPSLHPTMRELVERTEAHRHRTVDCEPDATQSQHARGKLTARERMALLFDKGSFIEIDAFARHRTTLFGLQHRRPLTDGVVTGWGHVHGRVVFAFAHDFSIFGGALGEVFAGKIHKIMDMAESVGAPLVGLNDGAGARIQEGVAALAGYAGIFRRNVRVSGVIPQISAILGPCAGGAAYSPALTDFVFMVREMSHLFITGPDVIASVTGETVSRDELGGAFPHATRSGVAAFVHDDEPACLEAVRYLLSFLPSNNAEEPPYFEPVDDPQRSCDGLLELVPTAPEKSYDMRQLIAEVVDDRELVEVQSNFARNIVCGLARLDGHVVGIVGNQPAVLGGALDIHASEKAARFVRTCDAFNIPLVTFVDVPGFLPGQAQEHGGIIRHGAKLLYAYCEASVPRIQVVVRKAYGGAYIVMDSRAIGADLCLAWPSNEIAVMGADAAASIIFRKELAHAVDPESRRAELVEEYAEHCLNPYVAAERGLIDDVIDPSHTRAVIVNALSMLRSKRAELPRRKHGNTPL